MIGCIISFVVGSFTGALVMALCASSKNNDINISLEDTSGNIIANGDVKINSGQRQSNNIGQPHFLPCKRCALYCTDSIKELKAKRGILNFALCDDYSEREEER